MLCCPIWTLLLASLAMPAISQPQAPVPAASNTKHELMEIVLEKKSGDSVQALDAGHVFKTGDILRFRLRPAFDGYLYVTDLATSGKSSLLFPSQQAGADNRIDHTRDYVVPATPDGWFQVSGPAGYETVYFVMSPLALSGGTVPSAAADANQGIPQGTAPATMHPRCNDEIFKSRGECVDGMAGPRRVDPKAPLPSGVRDLFGRAVPGSASRDLDFAKKPSSSVVTSAAPMRGPVIYEFLVAHE